MRDVHCHILPGVDDGARTMDESLRMVAAAREAGIDAIVCTPHCRRPWFDFDAMRDAFGRLAEAAPQTPLTLGFEVSAPMLVELGLDWAPRLAFQGGDELLLELESHADAIAYRSYFRMVYDLQGMGLTVIVAHPERYAAVRRDLALARELHDMGCKLQASADFVAGGRVRGARHVAKKLLKAGLYDLLASDAHRPEHYAWFARAQKRFEGRRT